MGARERVVICIDFVLLYGAIAGIIIAEIYAARGWMNDVGTSVVDNDVATMLLRAESFAQRTSVTFQNVGARVLLTKNFTERLLAGQISVNTRPPSFFNDDSSFTGERRDHSGWYKHGSSVTETYPDTAVLRNPWRASSTQFLYQGFGAPDGFFRFYPLASFPSFVTDTYTCLDPSRLNQQVTGFDPRCRPWYVDAASDVTRVHDTLPYLDAFTGNRIITLSTAIINPTTGNFYGAVFADVQLNELRAGTISTDNLQTGEAIFLVDGNGNVVTGYGIVPGNDLATTLFLSARTANQATDFRTTVYPALLGSGPGTFRFNNGTEYRAAFSRAPRTNYVVVMMIAETQLRSATQSSADAAETRILQIAFIVIVFVIGTIYFLYKHVNSSATDPLDSMKKFGLPIVGMFALLLVVSIVLTIIANRQMLSDIENIMNARTSFNAESLAQNAVNWLEQYLASVDYRLISILIATSTSRAMALLQSDIAPGPNYMDDALSELAPPLVLDPRLRNAQVSLQHSAFYVPGTRRSDLNTLPQATRDVISSSNYLDEFLRSTYSTNRDVVLEYVGYETGGIYRKYPGTSTLANDTSRSYDPRNRGWYTGARGRLGMYYSQPYRDFFSGRWMITAAQRLADLSGVAGADVLTSTITTIISSITFFQTGKVTLLDVSNASVVADKELTASAYQSDSLPAYTSLRVPFISNQLWTRLSFGNIITSEKYTSQSNAVEYYLTSRPLALQGTERYVVMVSVPAEEAEAEAREVMSRIRGATVGVVIGLILGCILVGLWIMGSAYWLGKKGQEIDMDYMGGDYDATAMEAQQLDAEGKPYPPASSYPAASGYPVCTTIPVTGGDNTTNPFMRVQNSNDSMEGSSMGNRPPTMTSSQPPPQSQAQSQPQSYPQQGPPPAFPPPPGRSPTPT